MKGKKFCLITVSYNSYDDLLNLSLSLDKYNKDLFDWVIVDNQSKEDQKSKIINLSKEKGYIYIQSEKNGGFAYGSNIGIRHSIENGYLYTVLVNPDCIFTQDIFFVQCEKYLKLYNVITPLITYSPNVDIIYSAGGSINPITMMTRMRGKGEANVGQYNNILQCSFATGCSIITRTDIFKKVGLLPEEYFLYFEESDWCVKLAKSGYDIFYVPYIKIAHGVSKSIGYLSKTYIYYMVRNYPIFARKYLAWYNKPIFYIYYIFIWCGGYAYLCIKNKKIALIRYVFRGFLNLKF